MQLRWALGWVLAGALAGCQPKAPPPAPPATNPPSAETPHLNHAQPKLPTLKLWLGDQEIEAEVALTWTQIATGMMFRTNMAEGEGMLFAFAEPHRAAFYMKNTLIPLSVAYIAPDGVILEIHDLQPLDETPVEAATDQVQYVLEVPQGWFARHNIRPGVVVRTDRGALREAFVRRQ